MSTSLHYISTLLLINCCIICFCGQYNVSIIQITTNPIVSYVNGNSEFEEVYNPSFIIPSSTVKTGGLVMRTQNCSLDTDGTCSGCNDDGSNKNSSKLTFIECNNMTTGICLNTVTNPINNDSIIFQPETEFDILGTEDPRILYNKLDGYYYMFYTSYGHANKSNPKQNTVYLSLAKSQYPLNSNSWIRYGAIFDDIRGKGSKSGALLIEFNDDMNDFGLNYLYWGDTSIKLTISKNITDWSYNANTTSIFIETRDNGFDNGLVESGPPPLQLNIQDENGQDNYIFFYNSANKGWPHVNGSAYHPGFVIIDKYNKNLILQRSGENEPLLTPEFAWDKGEYPFTCNVPNVVFLEAAIMFTQQEKMEYIKRKKENDNILIDADNDLIRVYFGGADTVTGTAVVQVSFQN